jgi:hypothetical protein
MDVLQGLVGVAGAPVVVALVHVAKPWLRDQRLWPAAAIALGVAWNLALAAVLGRPLAEAALLGVLVGLAASGAWSAGKTVAEGRG